MTLAELRALAQPGRGGYHIFSGDYAQMSVTLEDAEFLYALVRLVKPALVLELGMGLGVSARFIAEALTANREGWLMTVEPDRALGKRAEPLLLDYPVSVHAAFMQKTMPDIVFIDSGYQRREADIAEWLSNGYEGLICVHDANRDYPALRDAPGVYLPGVDGLWLGRAA
jgi:predicted O-methyltransferase YrrM